MNNNKQRHLVAIYVYLGVCLTMASLPSSLLITKHIHLSGGNMI